MPSLPTCSRSAHEGRMANEELHGLITKLHDALERTRELDDESRRLLQQVAGDLTRLEPAAGASAEHAPLLESLAVRLESAHPAVSAAVRSLVDSLARAGV
jgi:hypothetical protein